MAERFNIVTIKDALVTLLNANISDLNSGLTRSVKQVVTKKPDNIVLEGALLPTVNVWLDSMVETFRGASTRKEVVASFLINAWYEDKYSIDASIDNIQKLADNIGYVLRGNISNASWTKGFAMVARTSFVYNTNESGFISSCQIDLELRRYLD